MYRKDPYKGVQHNAVRNTVGWYYFTHQLLEMTGSDTAAFLDRLCVGAIQNLAQGRARYTTMLDEDGLIVDDVIVFRLGSDVFWVSTLYMDKLVDRIDNYVGSLDVEYDDKTREIDMYSVQGPLSGQLLNTLLAESIDDQKYFSIRNNFIGDTPVKIARSGFTGELGYEIYVASQHRELVEERLTVLGRPFDAVKVTELEVQVMTLPAEKGYNLMCDIGGISPLEIDPDAKIDFSKDFIGKKALESQSLKGIRRQLVGFTIEGDSAHIQARNWGNSGEAVLLNGREVGRVTKFTYGYSVGRSIGYALIDKEKVKIGDRVTINGNDAELTERIWYDPENRRPLGR